MTINTSLDKCEFQLTSLLISYIEELKRTIGINQLIVNSGENFSSTSDPNEELKKISLEKLTSSKSGIRRLERVYNFSSNMIEKATNKIRITNLNDIMLPLDKEFLDFIMEVTCFSCLQKIFTNLSNN